MLYRDVTPVMGNIMGNQMENAVEQDMETGLCDYRSPPPDVKYSIQGSYFSRQMYSQITGGGYQQHEGITKQCAALLLMLLLTQYCSRGATGYG